MRDTIPAPATASTTPLAEEIYRLIGRSRRLLWMASARALEAEGESVFTWQVICFLVHYGPTVQQDLAMATAQDPAGTSRVLEELESRKLVRRASDPSDRRRSVVALTKRGEAWYRNASPTVLTAVDEAMVALSTRERKALRDLLRILVPLAAPPPGASKALRARRARRAGDVHRVGGTQR